jgi:hypothetical protein|tara:strand:+ start:82 stop:462 length:381 start_codon:yes stop_codon:yes gene_type:complete
MRYNMAHFAKVLDNRVINVIVAELDYFDTFIDSSPGEWIQCSYNTHGGEHYGTDRQPDGGTALRYNYPGVGYNYNPVDDAFFPDQPYPSWTLDKTKYLWECPVAAPDTENFYSWNEETQSWNQVDV